MLARTLRVGLALSVSLVLLGGQMATSASAKLNERERRLHRYVQNARQSRGIPGLHKRRGLSREAHRHSVRMARRGSTYHQGCLSCSAGHSNWSRLAENVAKARSVRKAHRALMRSRTHKRNILCRCHDRVGYGVVARGGWVYVTQIFMG